MNIKELNEQLEIMMEEQINEMAIKPWIPLPSKRNPKDCVSSILKKNQNRVDFLLNSNRKDRVIPSEDTNVDEHRVGCQSKYKLFTYNNIDYYFGVLWGEEDKEGENGKLLTGNGISHIMVNHGSNFDKIINNLNLAVSQISPKNIFKDRCGNLEIDVHIGSLTYVFKNYTELKDNYFYLHTAF